MNEVSFVAGLIVRLLVFFLGIGALGTMYDIATNTQKNAKEAIVHDQLSYSRWNKILNRQ